VNGEWAMVNETIIDYSLLIIAATLCKNPNQ
jgi:hypothetical protein